MTGARDLPPGAGLLSRAHRLAGAALLRLRAALKAPTTLGARLVAFDPAGRVLLVRHSYVPGWHLPGGAVDPDESALAAVLREAREEAGIEVAAPPRLLGLYRHTAGGLRDHVAVYVASASQAAAPPRSLEILDVGFFQPSALPAGTTAATRARIAEALGEAEPGSEW